MMLKVGITGGIGSGKTTVVKLFEVLDIPCYIADVEAKRIINSSEKARQEIIELLGDEAYIDGMYNSKYVAKIVFSDVDKLSELNKIVHPKVHQDFKQFCAEQTSSYVIYESALLLNDDSVRKRFDYIIGVTAPFELRMERVLHRDQTTREEVFERMKHQADENFLQLSSDFIINNIDLKDTAIQVKEIHKKILNTSRIHNR